jgi:hypothetical protein
MREALRGKKDDSEYKVLKRLKCEWPDKVFAIYESDGKCLVYS